MKFKKTIQVGIVVLIIAVGVFGMRMLGSVDKESNKRDSKPEFRTVTTENIEIKDIRLKVNGNGIVESKRSLKIVSEVSGKILFAKNDLKNGTYVKKGETVVKIDSREVSNELMSLRSDLMNTVASILPDFKVENIQTYEKWFAYFQSLNIYDSVPELPEIIDAHEKIKVSSRNIFNKYFDVKNKEIKLAKHTIIAPFGGFIKSTGILENSFVSVGSTLFLFDDVNNLEISVPLLVMDFNQIDFSKNPDVIISTEYSDVELKGKIKRKDNILERNSQSLNVYVSFKNPKLLSYFLPGNYVNVEVEGKTLPNVASISRNLIDTDNYVYTKEDGILNRTKVEILFLQNNLAIISGDFNTGSQIVTTILQKPIVGMNIQTIEEKELREKEEEIEATADTIAQND
jgi:multidrug efflux pump subunit AcrA (membrane-fusion protein)